MIDCCKPLTSSTYRRASGKRVSGAFGAGSGESPACPPEPAPSECGGRQDFSFRGGWDASTNGSGRPKFPSGNAGEMYQLAGTAERGWSWTRRYGNAVLFRTGLYYSFFRNGRVRIRSSPQLDASDRAESAPGATVPTPLPGSDAPEQ